MKKTIYILLSLLMIFSAISCQSSTNHEVALSQNKSVKGKNDIKRPEWVIKDMSDKKTLYKVAYGKGSTFEVSLKKAKTEAVGEIALYVSSTVDAIKERALKETNEEKDIKHIDAFASYTKEVGQAILSGVKEVDYWEDKEGGIFVLVSIPMDNIEDQIEDAIERTVSKDSKAYSLLESALDKIVE